MRYLWLAFMAMPLAAFGQLTDPDDISSVPPPAQAVALQTSAAPKTETPADIAAGCMQNRDCIDTYSEHRKLSSVQWDQKAYAQFVANYNTVVKGYQPISDDGKKAKKVNGHEDASLMDPNSGPLRMSVSAADWFQRLNDYPNHNRPGDSSWKFINDMLRSDFAFYSTVRSKTADMFVQLQKARVRPKDFDKMGSMKVKDVLPREMEERTFRAYDVVYMYLGWDARNFLYQKSQYLHKVKDGKFAGDANAQQLAANHFLNVDQPGARIPNPEELNKEPSLAKGDFKKTIKSAQNSFKNPELAFDANGVAAIENFSASSGKIQFSQGMVSKQAAAPTSTAGGKSDATGSLASDFKPKLSFKSGVIPPLTPSGFKRVQVKCEAYGHCRRSNHERKQGFRDSLVLDNSSAQAAPAAATFDKQSPKAPASAPKLKDWTWEVHDWNGNRNVTERRATTDGQDLREVEWSPAWYMRLQSGALNASDKRSYNLSKDSVFVYKFPGEQPKLYKVMAPGGLWIAKEGHVADTQGKFNDPSKVALLRSLPQPKNKLTPVQYAWGTEMKDNVTGAIHATYWTASDQNDPLKGSYVKIVGKGELTPASNNTYTVPAGTVFWFKAEGKPPEQHTAKGIVTIYRDYEPRSFKDAGDPSKQQAASPDDSYRSGSGI
jgi:hypothetical protein